MPLRRRWKTVGLEGNLFMCTGYVNIVRAVAPR